MGKREKEKEKVENMGDLGRLLLKNIKSWLELYMQFSSGEISEEEYRRLEEKISNQIEELIRKIAKREGE